MDYGFDTHCCNCGGLECKVLQDGYYVIIKCEECNQEKVLFEIEE